MLVSSSLLFLYFTILYSSLKEIYILQYYFVLINCLIMGGIVERGPITKYLYKTYVPQQNKDNEQQQQPQTKRDKKYLKQIQKYREEVRRCYQNIINGFYQKAVKSLLELVQEVQYLKEYQFRGYGNQESWHGLFKHGPIAWLKWIYYEKKIELGPYDLLSIALEILNKQQKQNSMSYIDEYLTLLEKYPKQKLQILLGLGNFYYNHNLYVTAEKYYLQALYASPHFAKTNEYLAWLYGYWFDHDRLARTYAQKSLNIDPESITCQYIFAISHQQKEQKKVLFRKLLQKQPNYYRIYINLGELEDSDRSVQYYNKCLEMDDRFTFAYLKLGDIQRFAHEYDEAKNYYLKAKQKNDDLQDYIHLYLGCLYQDEEKQQEALQQYSKCLQINPYNADICTIISNYYKNIGDSDQAFKFMHRQIENNPYDYNSLNMLGIYYDQLGDTQNSIKYFQKSIEINDEFYEPYVNLGSTFQQAKFYEKAKEYYLKAISLKENEVDPYYGMAICEGQLKNYQVGIQWCDKCIERGSDQDKEVYQYRGDLLRQSGRHLQSLKAYIKYSEVTHILHTEYILSNLIYQIQRPQAIQLVKQISLQIEDQYSLAQIGKLAFILQLTDITLECFNRLIKLSLNTKMSTSVEQEIKRFKGTSNHIRNNYRKGVRGYQDKLNLIILKKTFQNNFTELYSRLMHSTMANIEELAEDY